MDLSVQEEQFVRQSLATQVIPSPKLIIKAQKIISKKGGFPNRLVVPATNFTATLSKLGYLGIKIILDKTNVDYSRFAIVQSSYLKKKLEDLEINRYGLTIASVYAVKMHRSIKLATIRKSVRLFSRKVPQQPIIQSAYAWVSSVLR